MKHPHLKPQTLDVLAHLATGERLTPAQARDLLGIDRLGARIYELRQAGYDIRRDLVSVKTRRGNTHVASYRLILSQSLNSKTANS